jgi:flagellar biosynthesis chaperone FliJ
VEFINNKNLLLSNHKTKEKNARNKVTTCRFFTDTMLTSQTNNIATQPNKEAYEFCTTAIDLLLKIRKKQLSDNKLQNHNIQLGNSEAEEKLKDLCKNRDQDYPTCDSLFYLITNRNESKFFSVEIPREFSNLLVSLTQARCIPDDILGEHAKFLTENDIKIKFTDKMELLFKECYSICENSKNNVGNIEEYAINYLEILEKEKEVIPISINIILIKAFISHFPKEGIDNCDCLVDILCEHDEKYLKTPLWYQFIKDLTTTYNDGLLGTGYGCYIKKKLLTQLFLPSEDNKSTLTEEQIKLIKCVIQNSTNPEFIPVYARNESVAIDLLTKYRNILGDRFYWEEVDKLMTYHITRRYNEMTNLYQYDNLHKAIKYIYAPNCTNSIFNIDNNLDCEYCYYYSNKIISIGKNSTITNGEANHIKDIYPVIQYIRIIRVLKAMQDITAIAPSTIINAINYSSDNNAEKVINIINSITKIDSNEVKEIIDKIYNFPIKANSKNDQNVLDEILKIGDLNIENVISNKNVIAKMETLITNKHQNQRISTDFIDFFFTQNYLPLTSYIKINENLLKRISKLEEDNEEIPKYMKHCVKNIKLILINALNKRLDQDGTTKIDNDDDPLYLVAKHLVSINTIKNSKKIFYPLFSEALVNKLKEMN